MLLKFRYLLALTLILQFVRFPYVFVQSGGGGFLYIYFIVSIVIGGCLFMGELILGKITEASLGSSVERLALDRMTLEGNKDAPLAQRRVGLAKSFRFMFFGVGLLICSYISIIAIWLLVSLATPFIPANYDFELYVACAIIHFLAIYVFYKKQVRVWMPVVVKTFFFCLMFLSLYLVFSVLISSKNNTVLLSLFYPDYSKMAWSTLINALGQSVLSLLLGYGLVTQFGGSLNRNRDVTFLATRMVSASFIFAVLSSIIVLSVVHNTTFSLFGPRYFIETLPKVFSDGLESVWLGRLLLLMFYGALMFFVLRLLRLYKKDIQEKFSTSYKRVQFIFLFLFVTLTSAILYANLQFRHFKFFNQWSVFEFFDITLIDGALVFCAVATGWMIYATIPGKQIVREFVAIEIDQEISHFYPVWKFVMIWFTPVVTATAVFLSFIGWFR